MFWIACITACFTTWASMLSFSWLCKTKTFFHCHKVSESTVKSITKDLSILHEEWNTSNNFFPIFLFCLFPSHHLSYLMLLFHLLISVLNSIICSKKLIYNSIVILALLADIHGPCNCRTGLNESTHGSHTHYYVSTLDFEARILGMSLKPKLYNSCVIFLSFFWIYYFISFTDDVNIAVPLTKPWIWKLMVHLQRNKIQRRISR